MSWSETSRIVICSSLSFHCLSLLIHPHQSRHIHHSIQKATPFQITFTPPHHHHACASTSTHLSHSHPIIAANPLLYPQTGRQTPSHPKPSQPNIMSSDRHPPQPEMLRFSPSRRLPLIKRLQAALKPYAPSRATSPCIYTTARQQRLCLEPERSDTGLFPRVRWRWENGQAEGFVVLLVCLEGGEDRHPCRQRGLYGKSAWSAVVREAG